MSLGRHLNGLLLATEVNKYLYESILFYHTEMCNTELDMMVSDCQSHLRLQVVLDDDLLVRQIDADNAGAWMAVMVGAVV